MVRTRPLSDAELLDDDDDDGSNEELELLDDLELLEEDDRELLDDNEETATAVNGRGPCGGGTRSDAKALDDGADVGSNREELELRLDEELGIGFHR